MSRSERRAERIKSEVPIEQVLNWYGYDVMVGGGSREQQFRCDLHGDGSDNKPSARCYPETNQWYCWACGRSRDAIQTVREKEGLAFIAALDRLEKQFHLPTLPWEEGDNVKVTDALEGAFTPKETTFEDEKKRVSTLLRSMYKERTLALPIVLVLTEDFDHLCCASEANPQDESILDSITEFRSILLWHLRSSCQVS